MDVDVHFGSWLKRRRKALDLTQEDLARRVGYSVSAIRKVEADKLRPSKRVAEQLAEALGVAPEERPAFMRFARDEPTVDELDLPLRNLPLAHSVTQHRPNNCPIPLTSFIGRERELAEVKQLLSTHRLLTLTGAGGVGKTRLAIQLAADLADVFQHGVWWVELAARADPALVPQVVADALGLPESPNQPLIETLANHLLSLHALLVLDNCEHLVTACAQLSETLLQACSNLHILATSREPLSITGELIWPVPPLSVPIVDRGFNREFPDRSLVAGLRPAAGGSPPAPASAFERAYAFEETEDRQATGGESSVAVLEYEAVRLFVERVALVQPGFSLTQQNAPAAVQICQRLDGLPLAIELAAACARILSIEQIAARLDDRFNLLTLGSRTALPRYQTLRATIDWSYDLLSQQERVLVRRLSVFAGSFTLEAADAVCAGAEIESHGILNLLAHLVAKSLVVVVEQREETRYGLLETIRQYAHEKVAMAGEAPSLQQRHAHFFLALAEAAAPQFITAQRNMWMHRLQAEHENLRVALDWSVEQQAAEIGFRLIEALEDFWVARGYLTEARSRLEELLALPGCGLSNGASKPDGLPSEDSKTAIPRSLAVARAGALNAGARWALYQDDLHEAQVLAEQSVAEWRALNVTEGLVWALSRLGEVQECFGDEAAARVLWQESLDLARSIGQRAVIGWCLLRLGRLSLRQGHAELARSLMEQSLAIWRAQHNTIGIWSTFRELSSLALSEGDYIAARALLEESLNLARGFESTIGIIHTLLPLGHVALWQGDDAAARSFYAEALAIGRASNQKGMVAVSLCGLGMVAFKQGEFARARERLCESLSILQAVRNKPEITQCLECLTHVAAAQARPERVARLLGIIAALRETLGFPSPPDDALADDFVASVRAALGEQAFAAAFEAGRAMMVADTIEQG